MISGLRGVGKTVLLEDLQPLAIEKKWVWAQADMSESVSVSEQTVAMRILTDLSVITSNLKVRKEETRAVGFVARGAASELTLNYQTLLNLYNSLPGLVSDKLKGIFQIVWGSLRSTDVRGIIFAYDEAQTLSDHSLKEQYPLALILDVFASIQKKGIPFMLVLVGLPTLFTKCVDSRTFSERMFKVISLEKLNDGESREAIETPLKSAKLKFPENSIRLIIKDSGGYPYFLQFICKEVFDVSLQKLVMGGQAYVPIEEIIRKLDKDFFAGRWSRVTDRQRELLFIIATLPNADFEFTVQEIVEASKKEGGSPFSGSHVNQMLVTLMDRGLVYKNRHGKYSFAVPLLGRFILRQKSEPPETAQGDFFHE